MSGQKKLGLNRRFSPNYLKVLERCPQTVLLGQLQPTLGCCLRGRVCGGRRYYLTSRATTRGSVVITSPNNIPNRYTIHIFT